MKNPEPPSLFDPNVIPVSRLSRRRFMESLGVALGAAALDGCNHAPEEKLIPYVERPPEVVPGVGQYYATSTTRGGYGIGLLVQSHTGRPTKIEGHPQHPASLGRTLVQEQAELLTLYDPDRATFIRHGANIANWKAFADTFALAISSPATRPAGFDGKPRELFLLEPTASPLVASLLGHLRRARPNAEIYFDPSHAPVARWKAARALFGEVVEPQYQFDRAKRVLALDANFLAAMPMSIRWSNDFARGRAIDRPDGELNRLYVVESAMSVTGAAADHRLAIRASEVGYVAAALLLALGKLAHSTGFENGRAEAERVSQSLSEHEARWVNALARDLAEHRGSSIIVVGDQQPEAVHVLGMLLNDSLGNVGQTVTYTASPMLGAGSDAYGLEGFFRALDSGDTQTAFILGGNPAYGLPSDRGFAERIGQARERVYLSLYENETASHTDWFINAAHFLESWGNERAYDGVVSTRQPLIRPLYQGKSLEEVLAALAGLPNDSGHSLLRDHFTATRGREEDFVETLRSGVLVDTRLPTKSVVTRAGAAVEALRALQPRDPMHLLELDFLPDPRIEDGRLSNNAWLLELPEPISKLVWDNAALIGPETATNLGVARGDVIEIRTGQRAIHAPVFESPGQAPGTIAIWLGWGRKGSEQAARDVGVNAGPLRRSDAPWVTRGIEVRKTGRHHRLVTTQDVHSMHGRDIALYRSLRQWQQKPDFARHLDEKPDTIFPDRSVGAPQWGMTVDLNRCTGCSTCVTACQAENNIPVVGKEMVAMGREMHWMRIDVYQTGSVQEPTLLLQPMLCQHCEKAPCEYVCPVNATVHSSDGLNQMVYNRCVGTRFCSNNCPYKVRRFNYFDYNQNPPEVTRMVFNPNVTVRARGVMEKCSYCVQRIRRAQIDAKLEGHPLREQDVVTACQQACPTDAIVFGQISDPNSRVSKNYANLRTYAVLNDLGTQPRTRYLARIQNLNEEMPP